MLEGMREAAPQPKIDLVTFLRIEVPNLALSREDDLLVASGAYRAGQELPTILPALYDLHRTLEGSGRFSKVVISGSEDKPDMFTVRGELKQQEDGIMAVEIRLTRK